MANVKIKPIHSTVIKDKTIWNKIISEVTRKPSPAVIERNKKSIELLKVMQE
jgi:hypothetical protein